ncbi:MAG: ATP-binding protein [Desulfurellaceae bacterium]|nr:ATP-binding protein [Desulfurellaceae bacterium]
MNEETLEVSLVNDLKEIARVAEQIDEFCASHDLTSEVAYAVNLALDEILTNTISYGYDDDEPHRIEIIVSLEAEALVIVIADDSAAFDLSNAPTPDIGASLEERPLGGLGLFLVHQMMDSVEYRREEGRNIVTLKKNKAAEQSPDEG